MQTRRYGETDIFIQVRDTAGVIRHERVFFHFYRYLGIFKCFVPAPWTPEVLAKLKISQISECVRNHKFKGCRLLSYKIRIFTKFHGGGVQQVQPPKFKTHLTLKTDLKLCLSSRNFVQDILEGLKIKGSAIFLRLPRIPYIPSFSKFSIFSWMKRASKFISKIAFAFTVITYIEFHLLHYTK